MGNFRTILFGSSIRKVMRWQRTGAPADRPAAVRAEWDGDPRLRKTDFPSGYPGAPVFSRRVADLLKGDLSTAGSFVPVLFDDADAEEYFLYLVEEVVDCLDTRRSSKPKKAGGQIKNAVFHVDALPVHLPAFRVPEYQGGIYWNGWAVDRVRELLGDDLEVRLVWSEDPTLTPHHNPMGF
ncbi:hypothetical protein [Streptomyces sp. ME19-01-6]|uniref:hypothetical protein n=1 Tax=Streptomyces sp. ME19-01-6 TaxID=3028686 RepID=UPI0029B0A19E|nr:hypothetical protein [Streptomyces sp. ME19-01-6]MDX3231477.1 hypothetical protein [Streptomyces sp. ME19-01-6]